MVLGRFFRRTKTPDLLQVCKPVMRVLEPRILLDAAGFETAGNMAEMSAHVQLADDYVTTDSPLTDDPMENGPTGVDRDLSRDVAFIDGSIENIGELLNGLNPDVAVHIVYPQTDGVQQIADILRDRRNLASIHIFSHGGEGFLNLGSAQLTLDSISNVHAEPLAMVGTSLGESGDILIYGCNFGAGTEGEAVVSRLSDITGADVAASNDLTGHESLDGDWDLEVVQGEITTETLKFNGFMGVLGAFELGTVDPPAVTYVNGFTPSGAPGFGQVGEGGTVAVWTNAGTVEAPTGTVTVDVRATVTSVTNASEIYVGFGTRDDDAGDNDDPALDDFRVYIHNTSAVAGGPDTGNIGSATVIWEIFESGTNQTVRADIGEVSLTTADIDGTAAGTVTTRETLAAAISDLSSYTVQAGSNLTISNDGTNIRATGSTDQDSELTSWVQYSWNSVNQLAMVYETRTPYAYYNHDGDGDLVFTTPNTSDAPSGSAPAVSTAEDMPVGGTVTMTDPDAGDTPEATLDTGPSNGSVVVNPDGTYIYTPAADYAGPDSFTVVVTDDDGLTDTVTVTVTVTPVNDAPDASNDSVNVTEDTATALNPTLPADIDDVAADLTITVTQIPTPAQGVLTYTLDGGGMAPVAVSTTLSTTELATVSFAPVADYAGSVDAFTYTVTDDDGLSDAGSDGVVSIVMVPVNDAPDAATDSVNVTEDTVTALNPTLPTDIDDVAADLTITVTQIPTPAQGTLTYTPDGGGTAPVAVSTTLSTTELATVSFAPVADYEGAVDAFTYTVSDDDGLSDAGSEGSVAIVMVPVNDAPAGTAPAESTAEDTPVGGTVTMTDPDAGDTPEATLGTGPSNGSVVVNPDGTYIYTPAADYAGPDSFTVVVTDDDGLTDTVTVTVTVTPVNDAPDAATDSVNVTEDTVTALNPTLPTDIDDVAADLTITVTQIPTPAQGTLTYTLDGGGTAPVAVSTTLSTTEFASLIFTPVTSYTGPVADLTYTVTDDDGLSDTGSDGSVSLIINGTNDAPDAFTDSVNVTEDTVTALNPTLPTDVDDVAADLTVTVTQIPTLAQGVLTYTLDGGGTAPVAVSTTLSTTELATVSFAPVADYVGPVADFTYTVSDDDGLSDAGSDGVVSIVMVPVNDAPDAATDSVNVTEDTVTPLNPTLPTDIDDVAADLTITVTQVPTPAQGVLTYTLDGGGTAPVAVSTTLSTTELATVSFAPVADYEGAVDAFTYTVSDDDGLSDAGSDGSVAIVMVPVNDAPSGSAPAVSTAEDTPVGGTVTMTDPDVGDTPEATLGTGPSNGSVVVNPDGTYIYTPAADYAGPDSFTVVVTDDDGLTDTVTVAVTVTPVNDAPDAATDSVNVTEDTATALNPTLPTDIDDVAADLTVTVTQIPTPAQGVLTYTLDGGGAAPVAVSTTLSTTELATVSFAPVADYAGPVDDFTYTVSDDDGLSDAGSDGVVSIVMVPVNDAPDAFNDSVNVTEDTATALNPTLPADIDDVAADLTITVTQIPTPAQGVLTYTLDGGGMAPVAVSTTLSTTEFASLIFTPVTSYTGPVADLTYTVTDDDGLSDTGSDGSVSLIIGGINDAPDAATDSVNVTEDTVTPLNPTLPTDIDDVAADLTITVTQVPTPAQGTLIYEVGGAGTGTFAYVRTTGSGSTLDLDELATVTFTPAPDYTGPVDLFTYVVTDDEGANDAGSVGSVSISITPVNDAPSAISAPVNTAEDTTVNSALTLVDPDGDTVTAMLDTGPSNGTASVNPDGSWSYAPDPDWHGTDTFTVALDDGVGGTSTTTVSITVMPVDDIADDVISTPEDTPIIVNAITGANTDGGTGGPGTDTFDATPMVTGVTQGLNGSVIFAVNGDLTYTPDPDFNGTDSFTYTVTSGGQEETATVTVNVAPVNDIPTGSTPPVTTPEDVPVSGTITVDDPDGDIPTLTVTTPPVSGTVIVQPDGTYTYTPDPDFNGMDTFTVTLEDPDGGTSTVLVQVTVTPENDAPVGTALPVTTPEDVPVSGSITMTDPDGDVVTATLVTPPMHGTVTVLPNGDWDYVPDPDYNGPDSFLVSIEDSNGAATPVTVDLTVTPVNDLPTASAPPATTPEDTPVSGTVTTSDPDGTPTTTSLSSPPANGSVVVQPNGDWEYTPSPDFNGIDTFDVLVSDPDGGTVTVTVQVTVTPVNDAPVATAPPATTLEDIPVSGSITMSDPDGPAPVASLGTPPASGTVTVQPDGSWTYTPDPNFSGADSFIIEVMDTDGAKTSVVVDVDVMPVNDAPVAGPPLPPVSATDSSTVTIDVSTVFTDVDSSLTYSQSGLPAGLTIEPSTGLITGTLSSDASVSGPYSVAVTASDGVNSPVTTVVVIEVDNVDPIALKPYSDTVYEQLPLSIDGLTLVEDPDGDTLTWSSPNLPSWITVDPTTGQITGTPPKGSAVAGPVQFSLVADDGQGGIASTNVALTPVEGDVSFIEPRLNVPGEDIEDEPKGRFNAIESVTPFIVSAVNEIDGLNSKQTIESTGGIIAETVERISGLNSTESTGGADPAVLKAVEAIESLKRAQVGQLNGLSEKNIGWNTEWLTVPSNKFGDDHVSGDNDVANSENADLYSIENRTAS